MSLPLSGFHLLTFEVERLVPSGVERSPLDLGLESVLLVGQQRHAHVRVRQTVRVLRSKVLRLLGIGILRICYTVETVYRVTSYPDFG